MSVWTSEALDVHHDLAHLDCAREELDRWLLHEALRAQAAGSAHTTVWTRPGDPVVVAFYSIAQILAVDRNVVKFGFGLGFDHELAACDQRRGDIDDWSLRIPPCTRPHRGVDCTGTSAPCGGCSVEVADPISTRTEPKRIG